nr:MAG TPA: hypothetical protein [Caudoviricetes sp.]
MAQIKYSSIIPNDKPGWLLNVQKAVENATGRMSLQGNERDFTNLQAFVNAEIAAQRSRGNIRADSVKTEIRTDEGRTVLHIYRNCQLVQTYYIE